jgi:ABC-type uncharacterized transport system substrate-binding protein
MSKLSLSSAGNPGRFLGAWRLVIVLLLLAACPAHARFPGEARQAEVTIVLSEKGGSYEEFANALSAHLSGMGVSCQVTDSGGAVPVSGLIVAVGTKAATVVAASEAPAVLNVLITKASYNKLLHDFPRRASSRTYSAIYLDQPTSRQVSLIAAILPGKLNVGLLYSAPPKELPQLQQSLSEHGLVLRAQKVDSAAPLSEALQDILGRSDILLVLPDAAVYNDSTIRNILLATYRMGVPLVGLSAGYVKAGALCAVFSTPAQVATQAVALISQFKDAHVLPAPQYPQEFEVLVNEQVAHSMGLRVKTASVLHDEINSEVKEAP